MVTEKVKRQPFNAKKNFDLGIFNLNTECTKKYVYTTEILVVACQRVYRCHLHHEANVFRFERSSIYFWNTLYVSAASIVIQWPWPPHIGAFLIYLDMWWDSLGE